LRWPSLVADGDDERRSLVGRGVFSSSALGLSISLDELTIGVAFGLLRLPLVPVIALIALQAFILAQVGMRAGERIGTRVRDRSEHLAGVALAVLATGLMVVQVAG
jgi:putative Mn2+ efflux pump MntP